MPFMNKKYCPNDLQARVELMKRLGNLKLKQSGGKQGHLAVKANQFSMSSQGRTMHVS